MSTKTVNAIILSRINYGEADRLITAFSRQEGKIKIVARGARKIKSRLAAHAEPFSVGKYFLAEGKTFYILAGAESENNLFSSDQNLDLYKDISYVFEILNFVTVDLQPNEKIYDLTLELLQEIYTLGPERRKLAVKYYEYKLLQLSGYLGSYKQCKKCGKALEEQKNYKGTAEGFYCPDCSGNGQTIDLNTFKLIRLLEDSDLKKILSIKDAEKYADKIGLLTEEKLYDILPKIPKSKNL